MRTWPCPAAAPTARFGAGLLKGWTDSGTRPVFKVVTGVSTGALMAPFAFVGPDYDDALRQFYTTTRSSDIFTLGSVLWQLLADEALADTRPLQRLIARHVDAELMRRVAEAHLQGRRLYIGTADLDVPHFVVWNMGLIATSGRPDALDLFRKVMLASASIPVAFPPVLFDVELQPGGPRYDELHVDGGVGARVFLNGGVFRGLPLPRSRRARRGRPRGHLRHPQRPARADARTGAALARGDRRARHRCVGACRRAGRPAAHPRLRAESSRPASSG